MTLEDAIKHCEENAKEQRDKAVKCFNGGWSSQILGRSCIKCAEEHEQLSEWLTQLKRIKEAYKTNEVMNLVAECMSIWGE